MANDTIVFFANPAFHDELSEKLYYNQDHIHASLDGITPGAKATNRGRAIAKPNDYRWESHCRGLYQLPAAA